MKVFVMYKSTKQVPYIPCLAHMKQTLQSSFVFGPIIIDFHEKWIQAKYFPNFSQTMIFNLFLSKAKVLDSTLIY